jgi:hypothetical protein
VQVIGQQWAWTYRYPQFGGFETTQLMLPVNEPVQFNVTSLDVIHSFWAYQLGVKADANPGVNNVAYTTPEHTGSSGPLLRAVRLWHGAMFDYGRSCPRPPSRPGRSRPRCSWPRDQDAAALRADLRPDRHPQPGQGLVQRSA